ncbi:hypothetical protein JMJ35_008353 [Cladonia borealis]|uniref:Tat pathway signal sequence n=1 Tax=Cladonia borealis TaxID=184061 RepID=A0AA39QTK8_9LECA|nr:hypothetical protein JMJ35_008353 [Cladonia borealis]
MTKAETEPFDPEDKWDVLSSAAYARDQRTIPKAWLAMNITFLTLSAILFGLSLRGGAGGACISHAQSSIGIYSPLAMIKEPQRVWIDAEINTTSVFKGAPSDEVDEAWSRISDVPDFSVSNAELQLANMSSIELYGMPDRHLVQFDVFHNLHCLNYLRKSIYMDYYREKLHHSGISHLDHADHCIDIIRQSLQCHSDTTMLGFEWRPQFSLPAPIFSAVHNCPANFQKLTDWMWDHGENLKEYIVKQSE